MQKDAKMVSYKVVDKASKPYVEVTIADEKKVRPCLRVPVVLGSRWRMCMAATTVSPHLYAASTCASWPRRAFMCACLCAIRFEAYSIMCHSSSGCLHPQEAYCGLES